MRINNEYRYSPITTYVYAQALNMEKAPNERSRGPFGASRGCFSLGSDRWWLLAVQVSHQSEGYPTGKSARRSCI